MITVLKDVGLIILAGAALIIAVVAIISGVYEMIFGRNVPGVLGTSLLPRRGTTRSDNWSASEWRRNGYVVSGVGLGFVVVALWLISFTLR